MLDPSVEAIERRIREEALPDPFNAADGAEARRRAWAIRNIVYPSPLLETGSIEDRFISNGSADGLRLRIVHPPSVDATGTVVYLHGGGWIVGDVDSHAAHAARIAARANCVVVNVDYRLAPENIYPAGLNDAISALRWACDNLADLGGDPAKLVIAGDSAGGNLAALAALYARDQGISLAAQLLVYPVTDMRLRIRNDATDEIGVAAKYLGPAFRELVASPQVSPACASLAGVAPVILGVGQRDFLYADNVAYAEALSAAGVPVTLREFSGLNHSFFSYTGVSDVCRAAADLLCNDLSALIHERG